MFGSGMGNGNPGSVKGNQFVVADIGEAAAYLDRVGVENSGVMHVEDGVMKPGPDPEGREFGSFVFFDDPDGNTWSEQADVRA